MFQFVLPILLQSALVFAGPEPCEKFDGKEYDECVDKLSSEKEGEIQIQPEDIVKNDCHTKTDSRSNKACIKEANLATFRNAKERKHREETNQAVTGAPPKRSTTKCDPDVIQKACLTKHREAQMMRADPEKAAHVGPLVQQCQALCTTANPEVAIHLAGCTSDAPRKAVIAFFDKKHRTCGDSASPKDIAEDHLTTPEEKKAIENANNVAGNSPVEKVSTPQGEAWCAMQQPRQCYLVKDPTKLYVYDAAKAPPLADVKKNDDLISGGGTVESTSNYHTTRCATYSTGVKECITNTTGVDTPQHSYTTPDGKSFNSYESLMASQNGYVVPIPPTRPNFEPPVAPVATGSKDSSSSGAIQSSLSDSQSSGSQPSAPQQETAPAAPQQQVAASPQAQASPPAAMGSAGQAAAASSNFTNPFGNSSLVANNFNNQSFQNEATRESFSSTSPRNNSSVDSESVGGGDGSGYGGSGFGDAPSSRRNNGGSGSSGSEGVNRDLPRMTAPLGGGPTVAVASANTNGARAKTVESLNGSTFNNGYHKANGSDKLLHAKNAKESARIKKMRRKKLIADCKGDMQCLAVILGKGKMRNARGLASTESVPKGVWHGYTDILSHMAKVHDKMPMDFNGALGE